KKYSKARLNAACARALKTKVWRLSGIKSILEKGLDKRKRKLTAVCSHQTRIGNLDAHLI
ncbi:IS21 family transposase, partial [Escherichia coli]|nr:IS21 family transposase [Escherichia coli]MDL7903687.1 IS21 family transposase [Escherichia coli]MDL8006081.1 IS21 family transposase [Escherichia coli]MDL8188250.1 IS21 family transposase [Escherichia coli]